MQLLEAKASMPNQTTYPINTNDDEDVFVVMRRVHWYVDDLISHTLYRRGIGTSERRLLDALQYARQRGVEAVSTSSLCDLAPTLRPQTAVSVLNRLENQSGRTLVRGVGTQGRNKLWSLTDEGFSIREAYSKEVERQLQVFFDSRFGSSRNSLLDRVPTALDYIHTYRIPIVDRLIGGPIAPPFVPTTAWSGLRLVHLYISDTLYHQFQAIGVGHVDRRVLDVIGYAGKHGLPEGLNLGTICRLNDALTRTVAHTAVKRMVEWGWLAEKVDGNKTKHSAGRILWRLTDRGHAAREAYKRRSQLLLQEIYDPNRDCPDSLMAVASEAHSHRDGRLLPGLDYLKAVAA